MHRRNMNKTKRAASPLVFSNGGNSRESKSKFNVYLQRTKNFLYVMDHEAMLSHFLYDAFSLLYEVKILLKESTTQSVYYQSFYYY